MEVMAEVEVVSSSKVGGESSDMMESLIRLDPEIYEWPIAPPARVVPEAADLTRVHARPHKETGSSHNQTGMGSPVKLKHWHPPS